MKPFANLKQDAPASLVVFFVAVPLCLGIALASGAPLLSGIIAGIVGGIVVGIISQSQVGVSGPAAGLAVIVAGAIQDLGSFETFLAAVVLAGVLQIVFGLVRAGILAYFFPSSVIKGMLAGIGVLIVLKQIPHAFGHDTDPEGDLSFQQPDGETTLSSLQAMVPDFTPSALLVTLACLGILIVWEAFLVKRSKVFTLLPGPVVAVLFGVAFQWLTSRFAPSWALDPIHLVSVPVAKSADELMSLLTYPDWSQLLTASVWITAITLAVVASLETLLCVEATDKLDPEKRVTPTSRELIAQGVGNAVSGAIGGLPVTQVIVRSSANIQSGGRTKLSAILHGILLLVFAVALPELLNQVPLAALAAILFVVGYKLARPAIFRQMFAQGPNQFVPFVVTIVAIVLTDLLTGIGIGMAVALFSILKTHYQNSHFLHVEELDAPGKRHKVTFRLAEEVTFLNKGALLKELKSIPDGSDVTIDGSRVVVIDQDASEIIEDFIISALSRDIRVRRIEEFDVPTPPSPDWGKTPEEALAR